MYSCLFDMAEEKYRLFALKLLPDTCQEKLIGVRLPKLRLCRDTTKSIVI